MVNSKHFVYKYLEILSFDSISYSNYKLGKKLIMLTFSINLSYLFNY